jgi:alkylation response protein AidB-like acyl-CoA dehydrogenase
MKESSTSPENLRCPVRRDYAGTKPSVIIGVTFQEQALRPEPGDRDSAFTAIGAHGCRPGLCLRWRSRSPIPRWFDNPRCRRIDPPAPEESAMDFDFSDELKQLREEARRFLGERCPPAVPRRILDGEAAYDAALWQDIARLGWTGAAIPEQYGGAGLGPLAVCVLAEELGRALAPVPFASSVYLATEAILRFGNETQHRLHLPQLASGAAIGTFAVAERPGPLDPLKLDSYVADGWLHGVKRAVPDGGSAGFAVVAARSQQGAWLHLVDLTAAGVQRIPVATIDPSRPHAKLVFDHAAAEPLPGADSPDAIRALIDRAAVMTAFEQVGVAQAALDMARAYALERYAFGRPIGSFQAIKHKLADIYVAVELARSNAYYGAWALAADAAELPVAAAVARIAGCEAGWLATRENIQTHGGMGFTWQLDCHLCYRRAKLLALGLGSAREWKHRLIRQLRARNAAAEIA